MCWALQPCLAVLVPCLSVPDARQNHPGSLNQHHDLGSPLQRGLGLLQLVC